jgi:DNA-binding response OmpR family regulator
LVAEDEAVICEFIVVNLKRSGYDVVAACDGQMAIDLFEQDQTGFGAMILDVMMPKKDGLEVCKYVRAKDSTVGIIMLSAKSQEIDKVSGLMAGADDYLTKPFSPSELVARVDALFRRIAACSEKCDVGEPSRFLKSGPFELDSNRKTVSKNGVVLELTPMEYELMKLFLEHKRTAFSRADLVERVWSCDNGAEVDEKVVDVCVRRLRVKIEDEPSNPFYIFTVWGVGYRWEGA